MADGKLMNELLVEFEFIVDLDMGIYKFMRFNYGKSPLVDRKFISLSDEREVIFRLLSRKHINPLEIIIPDYDTTSMYKDLLENHYEEILQNARAYDTFPLLITYLNRAHSLNITVWCKNQLERDYIRKLNPRLNTMIVPSRRMIATGRYSVFYVKYLANLFEYNRLDGKNIYFAAAKFNMEEDSDRVNSTYAYPFADTNVLHLMDLYTKVKYRFPKKEETIEEDAE